MVDHSSLCTIFYFVAWFLCAQGSTEALFASSTLTCLSACEQAARNTLRERRAPDRFGGNAHEEGAAIDIDDNNENITDRLQARADADEPMEHQE